MKKIIFTLLFVLVSPLIFGGDFAVIVNKSNSVANLSASDAKNVFLGKKTTWDSGDKIVLVVFKEGNIHETFLKEVVKKNPSQFNLFWKKAIFTGTGNPPKIVANDGEMLKLIAETPNAIGYVAVADGSVKEIQIQ